jgi:hypothetical protein
MQPPATILLAFANDWVDDRHHLRGLLAESKAIDKALAPLVEAGALAVPSPIHNATVDDVIGAFRERQYRDRIRIFHFGGHASGSMLLFEDERGGPSGAHAEGLAGYLARQRGLVLVFLNGCCTGPQVRRLREAGVHAVVATTCAIQDGVAAEFATAFYAELATRSLRDAYETAEQAVRMRAGDDPRSVVRDIGEVAGDAGAATWPWIFDCAPEYEDWTLASELAREARRARRQRVLVATAALPLVWLIALGVSAEVRRTSCRAPGLRPLCAAAGIGGVASQAEQARWDAARQQRSGDGLRAYLREYPDGAYADEARTRLATCTTERVEAPGAIDDRRYAQWRVNRSPARAFATKAEARADAQKRGSDDAHATCASFGLVDRLVSASIEPPAIESPAWDCAEADRRFTCGFEGELVCRVQRVTVSLEEHCNEPGSR